MNSLNNSPLRYQKSLQLKKLSSINLQAISSQERVMPKKQYKPPKSFKGFDRNKNNTHNKYFNQEIIQNIQSPRKKNLGIVINAFKNQKQIQLWATSNVFVFKKTNNFNQSKNIKKNQEIFSFPIEDKKDPYSISKQIYRKRNIKTSRHYLNSSFSPVKEAESSTLRRNLLRANQGINNQSKKKIQDNLSLYITQNEFEFSPWDSKNYGQDDDNLFKS